MLAVILCCLLVAGALLVHGHRSLAAPATLFTLSWALLVLFAVLFGGPYVFSPSALAVMSLLLASFVAGCLLVGAMAGGRPDTGEPRPVPTFEERWLPSIPRWAVLVCAAVGVVGAGIVSLSFGHSLLSFSSLTDLLGASQQNAVAIFRGENAIPFDGKLTFAILQLGCLLSGARFVFNSDRRQVWEMGSLAFAALLWSIVTTQRSYILVPAVWGLSGVVAAYVYAGGLRRVIRPRSVVLTGFGAVVFGGLVLALRLVRTGGAAAPAVAGHGLLDSSRPWLAGYIPAFSSAYVQSVQSTAGHSWSALFSGFVALVGKGSDQLSGGYQYIGNGDTSNAATILPFFIGGGGVFGAAIALFALGCACQFAYRRASHGSLTAALAYACAAAGILWSPNSWFYGYGGRLLTVIIAIALLLLAKWLPEAVRSGADSLRSIHVGGPVEVGQREVPALTGDPDAELGISGQGAQG